MAYEPFPFPAAGPYPDPADPSGQSLAITLLFTPESEEVRASYQRNDCSWRLSSLSLLSEGQAETFAPEDVAAGPQGGAARLREILGRVGLEPPRELFGC